jgi:squalene cyclase
MSSSRESSPIRVRPAAIVLGCALALATAALPAQERRGRDDEPLLITQRMRDAVERGHEWLAAAQHPDGYWSQDVGFKLNQDYRLTEADKPHVGVTALALMSFLAGGHLPGRGKYGDNIDRGLDYVLSCVRENGYITDWGSRMYSHAFATLFLAEIYGMTRRTDVRRALQDAVNIIVDSQNSEGGWRYKPFARESDMSITVCQVLALRSSRNVGITVSARTIRDAENYVRRSAVTGTNARARRAIHSLGYVNEGGAFRYQLREHSRATFALTAAGITTMYAAGTYDDVLIDSAFEYLQEQLPIFNATYAGHYFFYYGHYYAVQAFYVAGGDRWQRYFTRMRDTLLDLQQPDGHWPNNTGPGKAFSTAVSTLILQIPYQYLPIFQR